MAKRGAVIVSGVAAVAVGAGGAWATARGTAAREDPTPRAITTSTEQIVRTDVAERKQVIGTLSHGGTYNVAAAGGAGVITRLPAPGSVVRRGAAAYEVNGDPVPLLYGARPVWRPFALGMSNGPDVRQLEANLVALGHGRGLTVDRHFSAATHWAVRRWQRDAGLPVTGTVPLGQIVFVPGPLRVSAHDTKAGGQVRPGAPIAHGTSPTRTVEAKIDSAFMPDLKRGDSAVVTMPDGRTVPGRVTRVSPVAVSGSAAGGSQGGQEGGEPAQPQIPITISLRRLPRGSVLDQAEVQVAITAELHRDVLAVPVLALVPRAGGGGEYDIVVNGRRIPVRTGLFDETSGVVEVEGPGLAEGQLVEVPDEPS
jgi:peptidoglycan hydrolase-like protein with peptidoglycan-binding domain